MTDITYLGKEIRPREPNLEVAYRMFNCWDDHIPTTLMKLVDIDKVRANLEVLNGAIRLAVGEVVEVDS